MLESRTTRLTSQVRVVVRELAERAAVRLLAARWRSAVASFRGVDPARYPAVGTAGCSCGERGRFRGAPPEPLRAPCWSTWPPINGSASWLTVGPRRWKHGCAATPTPDGTHGTGSYAHTRAARPLRQRGDRPGPVERKPPQRGPMHPRTFRATRSEFLWARACLPSDAWPPGPVSRSDLPRALLQLGKIHPKWVSFIH